MGWRELQFPGSSAAPWLPRSGHAQTTPPPASATPRPRPRAGWYIRAEWPGGGQSAEAARARAVLPGPEEAAARPLARSPARRSALLPPPPRPRAPTSSGPRAELPRALSGPAEGMPAGTSGSRRRCAAKKGEARRRGCAPWSSGTRHLGTPAASSRHLRAAGARSPGLASGGKCGEWGEGLRTPHRGLLGVHQPGSDDPHPRDLVCVLGLLPSTWQSGRIPGRLTPGTLVTWRSLITRDTEGLRKVWESRDAARAPGPSHGSLTRGQWNPVKFLEHLLGEIGGLRLAWGCAPRTKKEGQEKKKVPVALPNEDPHSGGTLILCWCLEVSQAAFHLAHYHGPASRTRPLLVSTTPPCTPVPPVQGKDGWLSGAQPEGS
ncbi:translation initiation factor IF-2-like [Canis lupus dingo]|uniref:translation initiation factor IF-2-like n=1 Tax=Canis lupus dingo TaxID=286419 RepID=UPI0020C41669|nr:translation initiation factor IF-2-like [Canis lupus dingo]